MALQFKTPPGFDPGPLSDHATRSTLVRWILLAYLIALALQTYGVFQSAAAMDDVTARAEFLRHGLGEIANQIQPILLVALGYYFGRNDG